MGDEAFELQVNGETVLEVGDIDGGGEFSVDVAGDVTADDVRIAFTNDAWDPANGIDRNLIVDKIVIDGETFETEDPSTISTGTWNGSGFSEGNYQSEWLHGGGYFQFAGGGGNTGGGNSGGSNAGEGTTGGGTTYGTGDTLIQVRARGDEGVENMRVLVNGQEIASIDVTTSWEIYDIHTNAYSSGDDVRVEFTNDQWDPANGIDTNLYVDYVIADGDHCETEDPTTFGYGTWNNGFSEGYNQSEALHTNGYFIYKSGGDTEPPKNEVPVAVADAFTTDFESPVSGNVIGNDDQGDGPATISLKEGQPTVPYNFKATVSSFTRRMTVSAAQIRSNTPSPMLTVTWT